MAKRWQTLAIERVFVRADDVAFSYSGSACGALRYDDGAHLVVHGLVQRQARFPVGEACDKRRRSEPRSAARAVPLPACHAREGPPLVVWTKLSDHLPLPLPLPLVTFSGGLEELRLRSGWIGTQSLGTQLRIPMDRLSCAWVADWLQR